MRWLERIEKHFNWLAFPGLYKYLTFLGVLAFATQYAKPGISLLLDFDKEAIMHGEVWRLLTFPIASWGALGFTAWQMFLLFCGVMLSVTISDSMDELWGSTRVTLYILTSWILVAAVQFLFGAPAGLMLGFLVQLPLFFAFATFFPKYEILLMFILPIQIRFVAWITGATMLYSVIKAPVLLVIYVPALLPYALWVLPGFIRGTVSVAGSAVRRAKFNKTQMPQGEAFHHCESCPRTEKTDPSLNFYTLPDGKEYCSDHLPPEFAGKP